MAGETPQGERACSARILIADDHDLVRNGLQRMISGEPDLEVVGEATNGREAVELCRGLQPDLILMDVRMPEMDGLAATRVIKKEFPTISVLVVTTYENPEYMLGAVEAGAAGYVLKDTPKRQLVNAVRRTLNGESPLHQELALKLIQRLSGDGRVQLDRTTVPEQRTVRSSHLETITPRELEVLQLIAQGKTNPQIAQELFITKGTAKIHVQHIITKLGVSDRTQAVVRAVELGLLRFETRP